MVLEDQLGEPFFIYNSSLQERRKALEDERIARLEAMKKFRKEQEDKMNALKEQRERARESTVKEKAK